MLVYNISHDLKSEKVKRDWFSYWKYFKKTTNLYCAEVNCLNRAELGALVKKEEGYHSEVYVVGLCSCHGKNIANVNYSTLELSSDSEMVDTQHTL